MVFNGQVYSRDAMYLSNGTSGGAGPDFEEPVYDALERHRQPARRPRTRGASTPRSVATSTPLTALTRPRRLRSTCSCPPPSARRRCRLTTASTPARRACAQWRRHGDDHQPADHARRPEQPTPAATRPFAGRAASCNFTLNYSDGRPGHDLRQEQRHGPDGWLAQCRHQVDERARRLRTRFSTSPRLRRRCRRPTPLADRRRRRPSVCSTATPTNTYNADLRVERRQRRRRCAGLVATTPATSCSTDHRQHGREVLRLRLPRRGQRQRRAQYGLFRTALQADSRRPPAACGSVPPAARRRRSSTARSPPCCRRPTPATPATGTRPRRSPVRTSTSSPLRTPVGTTTAPPTIGSAPTAPLAGDPLFATKAGTAATTQQVQAATTFTVWRQVSGCYSNLGGSCQARARPAREAATGTFKWGPSTPSFTVAISQTQYDQLCRCDCCGELLPEHPGRHPVQRPGHDRRRRHRRPGDLYVEGTTRASSA